MYKLIILLLFTSCAQQSSILVSTNPTLEYAQAEELKPYFLQFEADFNLSTKYIQAEMSDTMSMTVAGACFFNGATAPKGDYILVNRKVWNGLEEDTKLFLLYHELGHCLLLKMHEDDGQLDDGCKSTLMYPKLQYGGCFSRHKAYYINKLINNANQTVLDLIKEWK